MKNRIALFLKLCIFCLILLGLPCPALAANAASGNADIFVDRLPKIHPEYTDITIPPNIAPLNFQIQEPGTRYDVKIYSKEGNPIEIHTRKPTITIPMRKWKRLLDANKSSELYIEICVHDENNRRLGFKTITNTIADVHIDSYLAYRKIKLSVAWNQMGFYQRNIENYDESIILHNLSFGRGCIHCHSFFKNSSNEMLTQIRSEKYGTPMIMVDNGEVLSINTETKFTPGKAGFTAWHPNGRVIAFSINKFEMFFHTAAVEVRDVLSHASDLALYLIDSGKVLSTGKITKPDRMETFPEFSPDGRYLYFCSAPQVPVERYREVRGDLMRISYDAETQKWGELETVLSAADVNGSITQPRFSPDGRFLLFNVSEYSVFPIHQAKCDLYLMDMQTGQYRRLDISSARCDAWHSWSSNGRWLVFSSKRMDGRFARPFISFIDAAGKAYKPFVLPQKDPAFYDSLVYVYNMPEILTGPVNVTAKEISRAIRAYNHAAPSDVITGATPGAEKAPPAQDWSSPGYDEPWRKKE
jgi:hypothetical protein